MFSGNEVIEPEKRKTKYLREHITSFGKGNLNSLGMLTLEISLKVGKITKGSRGCNGNSCKISSSNKQNCAKCEMAQSNMKSR